MLNKKSYLKIIQFMFSVGIIYFLFSHTDTSKILEVMHNIKPLYLYLALALLICQYIASSYRWLILVRITGFSLPILECIGSFSISTLINTTLPVPIAGDIMRMWVATRHGVTSKIAIYGVLSDRIINTGMLSAIVVVLVLPYMLWTKQSLGMININIAALIYAIVLLGAFFILLCVQPFLNKFKINLPLVLSPLLDLSKMNRKIMLQSSSQMFLLMLMTLLGQLLSFFAAILLAQGMHISLYWWQYLIGIAIAISFSSAPITPGGWGIREGVMVLALGQFQVSAEAALGVSIVFGIGLTTASIPGSILWVIHKYLLNRSEHLQATSSSV